MRPTFFVAIDTETTTDSSQRLLFGAWRYCRLDWDENEPSLAVLDEGLFYEDELPEWNPEGYEVLRTYAREHYPDTDRATERDASWQLRLQRRADFVEDVIWRAGYERKAHLVFFNAGFDLSRLAIRAADARAGRRHGKRPPDRRFVGGFSLFLWPPGIYRPWFKIKHLDSKRALKRFGGPKMIDPENLDDSEPEDERAFAGHILDCRTLSFALTNESHSLESACSAFGVPYTKREVEHGSITPEYVHYCREDVEATANLTTALLAEYARHPIEVQPTRAFSPASIAKGYLRSMGVTSPMRRLGDVPEGETWDTVMGYAMTAYYGGRTEVRIRRTPVPVVVLDFTSEYPTVCRLLDAWKLLTAARVDAVEDDAVEVQRFADDLSVDDLFRQATWPDLFAICQVEPRGEVLPVRARYDEHGQFGIGVNPYFFDAGELDTSYPWYGLPDVIASRLLGGTAPRIRRVIRFRPGGQTAGLQSTVLRGIVAVNPATDDFFRAVIEERERSYQDESLPLTERKRLRAFLKVLANSAGYGIYAEVNRSELTRRAKETVHVHGLSSSEARVRAPEEPGDFFFAPLAAIVTAAGRLLLAMLEREVTSRGGTYAACDTDSAFIVATRDGTRPYDVAPDVPILKWSDVTAIQRRFNRLLPFKKSLVPELLKAEHGSLDEELRCYAISAKRYALYREATTEADVVDLGEFRGVNEGTDPWDIAKPSQHGLGHLLNPADPNASDRSWVEDGWRWLMGLDQGGDPKGPPWLDRPAVSQVSISTPEYWHLFNTWNASLDYGQSIKPFGFMLVAYADPLRSTQTIGRLIHPYEPDPRKWLTSEWADLYEPRRRVVVGVRGRDGSTNPEVVVRTYRDILLSYLGHPEFKSAAADGTLSRRSTKGALTRRPVRAVSLLHIGKESNRLEERIAGMVTLESDFMLSVDVTASLWRLVTMTAKILGSTQVHEESRIPSSTLADLISGTTRPQGRHESALGRAVYRLAADWLREHGLAVTHDLSATLALFLAEFERHQFRVEDEYEAALDLLRDIKRETPGIVSRVADASGVSRRRLWGIKGLAKQEAVAKAVSAMYVPEGDSMRASKRPRTPGRRGRTVPTTHPSRLRMVFLEEGATWY